MDFIPIFFASYFATSILWIGIKLGKAVRKRHKSISD